VIPSTIPPPSRPRVSAPPGKSFALAWNGLARREKRFVVLWSALLIVSATVVFALLTAQQRRNVQLAAERNAAQMSATIAAVSRTQPERTPPPGHESDVPRTVKVGIYVNRIAEFSIVDSSWKADFYIWFSWEGDGLDPGETFKMVTGELLSRELLKKTDDGPRHYVLYRVMAQISKTFDLPRFPRDEHQLLITIEDKTLQSYALVYTTDPADSDISSRADVPGYAIVKLHAAVKPHSYKGAMGDPGLPPTFKATYSEFIVGIPIRRPTWGLFVKMFIALYIAMGLALAGFFLESPSERLALAGTAIFVAIMNAEANAPLVPATGTSTLGDVIDALGYCAIGVVIAQGIIYHRMHRGHEPRDVARVLDAVSLVLITGLYVMLNVGVLLAAQS
jgi:hypothetical protein